LAGRSGTLSSTRSGSPAGVTSSRSLNGTTSGNSFAQRYAWSSKNSGQRSSGTWNGGQTKSGNWNDGKWDGDRDGGKWDDDDHHHHSHYGKYHYGGYGYGGYPYSYGYRPYGYGLYAPLIARLLFGYGLGYGGYGYGGYGYGYGNGYGGYGYGYPTTTYYSYSSPTYVVTPPAPPVATAVAGPNDFAALGEAAFRNGDYDAAVRQWQHALVDNPQNTTLALLMGQALFAQGKYEDAAGVIQAALAMMPTEQWNTVVAHAGELYGDPATFGSQIAALEAAAAKTPAPAAQFLLGYYHGYLGDPARAVKDLEQGIALQPQDQMMQKLRDVMQGLATAAVRPATP
jgi:tetratricopeptide (TPR) repeat protein